MKRFPLQLILLLIAAVSATACTVGYESEPTPIRTTAEAGQNATEEPTSAVMPSVVTATMPDGPTPTPPATETTAPGLPATLVALEATNTPSPTLMQPDGSNAELLLPQMSGMVFWQDVELYQINEAGQFLPYEKPPTRWTNDLWSVENLADADRNFRSRELELTIRSLSSSETHSVTVPNAGSVEVDTFLGSESDWALIRVAHGDIYWDGWLPQSGLLNVRSGQYIFLGWSSNCPAGNRDSHIQDNSGYSGQLRK